MTADVQVAVLGARRVERSASSRSIGQARPVVTLTAFALLALYGALRWATMLAPEPVWRTVGLVGVAVAIAALGPLAHARAPGARLVAVALVVLGVIALFPISGYPLEWARHLRIAVNARAIEDGLASLPRVVVPFKGHLHWTRPVLELGAAMLLLGGALTLASSRRPFGEARLAGAALPMVVLAIVPSSLARPQFTYVHGAILFLLLAALVFSERIPARRGVLAALVLGLAGVAGLALAPALDRRSAWVNVDLLAGRVVTVRAGERFDWSQTYGPLNWPRTGTLVFQVKATYPDYWKAEDLDTFNGQAWTSAPVGLGDLYALQNTVPSANLTRWHEELTVTLRGITTSEVIGAGVSGHPVPASTTGQATINAARAGTAFGTYVTGSPMQPGYSYRVDAYAPEPTRTELADAGAKYPAADLLPQLSIEFEPPSTYGDLNRPPPQPVLFAPYGSATPVEGYADLTSNEALGLLNRSPYGRVYRLARRLERGTHTPYQYVQAVMHYLSHGFVYDQQVAATPLPLVHFLFVSKRGYCQQFAGAMALLLRMGGIPAHVAAGFATGVYQRSSHSYLVSDIDAHTWVEAWFPGYGWVKFDPTRVVDPTLFNPTPSQAGGGVGPSRGGTGNGAHGLGTTPHGVTKPNSRGAGGASAGGVPTGVLIGGGVLLLALIAAGSVAVVRSRRQAPLGEELLLELERAFERCGRPLAAGTTLASLEGRFRREPMAAGYIRAIRLSRFSPEPATATSSERRAMRRSLGDGRGRLGRLRALLALPPWLHRAPR